MPTPIRLIIMIGEIIGLGIVSIILERKAIKKAKEEHKLKVNFRDVITDFDTWFLIILNIINICIFLFSFYDLQFCSYHKLLLISSFTIFTILFIILANYYEGNNIITIGMIIIFFFIDCWVFVCFAVSLIMPLTGHSTQVLF